MSQSKSPESEKIVSKSRSESVESTKKRGSSNDKWKSSRSLSAAHSASRSASPRDSGRKSRRKSSSSSVRGRKSSSKSPYKGKKSFRGDRANPEPNNCIGIFGLSPKTTEDDLYSIFDRFGKIERLHLVTDRYTKESRGYCFINYQSVESASKAVTKADGMEIDSRQIRADFSITQKPHTPTPGQYMGKRTDRPREERGGHNDGDRRRGGGYEDRGRGYEERGRGNYDQSRQKPRRRSRSASPRRRSRSTSRSYRRNRSRSNDRSRRRNGGY